MVAHAAAALRCRTLVGARFRGERVPTRQTALRTVAGRPDSAKVLLHVNVLPDAKRAGRVMPANPRVAGGNDVVGED